MARILVIEDNATNLDLMIYLLRAFGHETSTAADGEAGLAAVEREAPELVICDVQLPRIDGYGVVARLKSHPIHRRVPIIAVTALAMLDDRNRMLAAGFDGYIAKPIEPENFVPIIERFVAAPAQRPAQAGASSETSSVEMPAAVHTVLVVDNSMINLELTKATLAGCDCSVLTAPSVAEALEVLRVQRPNLILSDVHMPGADGFMLLAAVKRDDALRTIPFAFLSSTSAHLAEEPSKAKEMGADRFITRPIEPLDLLDHVRQLLRKGAHHG